MEYTKRDTFYIGFLNQEYNQKEQKWYIVKIISPSFLKNLKISS